MKHVVEHVRRVAAKYWFGADTASLEKPPFVFNNEYITAVNAAGTGEVDLIKASAGDLAQVKTPLQLGNTATAALVLGCGTSASPESTAVADKNFVGVWTKSTATSGTSRNTYLRHFIAGAGGEGETLRAWTTINGVVAAGGVHGAHCTASMDATGSSSGLVAGVRATLDAATATRTLTGTLCALQVDSNIGANNTLPASASFIRVADVGTVKITNFLEIANTGGCLKGSAATGAATDALKVRMPDGSALYLSLIAAS